MCWSFLPHVRFLILLTVFELLPKTCDFTICSIFSNSSHVGWCTASPDTILELDTLVMIQTKFGFHWSSSFRGEDFWKSYKKNQKKTTQFQIEFHNQQKKGWIFNFHNLIEIRSPPPFSLSLCSCRMTKKRGDQVNTVLTSAHTRLNKSLSKYIFMASWAKHYPFSLVSNDLN